MDELTHLDPRLAGYLRRLSDERERVKTQMGSLARAYTKLSQRYEDDRLELKRLREWQRKTADRIKYIEDIPGKRVPYFLNFEIEFPGPTSSTFTIRDTRFPDSQTISMDGPFVGTCYLGAFRMKTYSLGPVAQTRPSDPAVGTEVVTPLTGRFRPLCSTADPFSGAYIGYGLGGQIITASGATPTAGATDVNTFRPGSIDFLFEISDSGSNRGRQNDIPNPSRYLFSEFDRPWYLPVSDFFERGAVVQVLVTPTRDLGFAELNYAALNNGFQEGELNPPNPVDGDGRLVVSVGGTLTFTIAGYKILQAQTPAV